MFAMSVLVVGSLAAGNAVSQTQPGDWARYRSLTIRPDAKASVEELVVHVGPAEEGFQWWRMDVKKPGDLTFVVHVLSEAIPMTGASDGDVGRVRRYLFKQGDRPFMEYRSKHSREPMIPVFDFREHLIPQPAPQSPLHGAFATTGTYLGNPVHLLETGHAEPANAPKAVKVLNLDAGLLIGTGRGFRDVDEGRITGRDYNYRPFLQEEYDEMERAGINSFRVDNRDQAGWVNERAVFFTQYPDFEDFPDILYRSNYQGTVMFLDEPAVLTSFARCATPADAGNLLRMTVAESLAGDGPYSSTVLARRFKDTGVYWGVWNLLQRDIPAWEAIYQPAWYEMAGGVSGVFHEGRYDLGTFHQIIRRAGCDLDTTAEEMFDLHYAVLRGAARCFDGYWGMSIYGQAAPDLSPMAVTRAYDQGARYIWFWTSDHGHHLPYKEQLELARIVRQREKVQPRGVKKNLLQAAQAAVVFPEGYIGWSDFWTTGMWNNKTMAWDGRNDAGATYRGVVGAALKQGILLARKGITFDFVVESKRAQEAGYKRLIRVLPSGEVENGVE